MLDAALIEASETSFTLSQSEDLLTRHLL